MVGVIVALLVLNGVIIFHEFGHYMFARLFGVEVLEFAVGFGPKLLAIRNKNGTRFVLKLLLFGGSCSMKGEQGDDMSEGSFSATPVWQRAIIIAMGPAFNMFLALVAAAAITFAFGVDYPVVKMVFPGSPAESAGLAAGDRLLTFNGNRITTTREYLSDLAYYGVSDEILITYSRGGDVFSASFPSYVMNRYRLGFRYSNETSGVVSVISGGSAESAGLMAGDIVKAIDGTAIGDDCSLREYVNTAEFDETPVVMLCDRGGKDIEVVIQPSPEPVLSAGFELDGVPQSVPFVEAIDGAYNEISYYLRAVYRALQTVLMRKSGVDDLSGPVGTVTAIGGVYSAAAKQGTPVATKTVLMLVALISASIGMTNLVPFPALDGFQLMFFGIEAVRGRPVSSKIRFAINSVGFSLIMLVMLYVSVRELFVFF